MSGNKNGAMNPYANFVSNGMYSDPNGRVVPSEFQQIKAQPVTASEQGDPFYRFLKPSLSAGEMKPRKKLTPSTFVDTTDDVPTAQPSKSSNPYYCKLCKEDLETPRVCVDSC